jgi:ferredoxin
VALVVFESLHESPVEVDAPAGDRLVDLCDEHRAPVPFSCRSASCGTCRVEIAEGGDLLDPPDDDEVDLLHILGDDPARHRLACQVRVRAAAGRIVVRTPTEW